MEYVMRLYLGLDCMTAMNDDILKVGFIMCCFMI